jgi:hypothetical protein
VALLARRDERRCAIEGLTHHRGGGLSIASDLPVPGLAPGPASASPDLLLDVGGRFESERPTGASAWYACEEFEAFRVGDGAAFEIRYRDGTSFTLHGEGRRVWARWQPPYVLDDVATYFVGPILGTVLRLQGRSLLHASAVGVDGRAVLLLGAAGAGKSTLTAALASRGASILADDVVAVTADGRATGGGSTRLRLWDDVGRHVYGREDLPRLCPSWDKRYVEYEPPAEPIPVGAVYVGQGEPGPLRIEPLAAGKAVIALLANGYPRPAYRLPDACHQRQLEVLAALAGRVPVRAVRHPRRLSDLGDLCDGILRDVATLG